MRTDPPTGDELARMLVSMRGEVMRAALQDAPDPTPARTSTRARVTAVAVALVGLLVVGGAGAALAAGIIPNPFEEPPAPVVTATPTPTPSPSPTPTPSAAPATPTPAPETIPDPLDPGTWVVDYDSVADLALGDPLTPWGSAAGLQPNPSPIDCPSGFYTIPDFEAKTPEVSMALVQLDARAVPVADPVFSYAQFSVRFGAADGPLSSSPSTPAGIRLGSSEEDLLAAYPDIVMTTSKYDDTTGSTTYAEGPVDGRYLVFRVGTSESGQRTVTWIQTSTFDAVVDICD